MEEMLGQGTGMGREYKASMPSLGMTPCQHISVFTRPEGPQTFFSMFH